MKKNKAELYKIEWDVNTNSDVFYQVASFDAEHKEIEKMLDKYGDELNISPDKKEWKSKYNSYVLYDYEPFCSDGFILKVYYPVNERVDFLKYLVNKQIDIINKMNSTYNMEEHIDNEHTQTTASI